MTDLEAQLDATPAGADGRRRQPRGDDRRARILDEAVRFFAAKGYRNASLSELAERLGMTHQGMLYYFGTKERLLLETVVERVHAERERFPSMMHAATFDSLIDVVRFNARSAELVRLYAVLAAESLDEGDPLHSFFTDRYRHMRDIAAGVLRRGQERGELRADVDPDRVAAEMTAVVLGMESQWLMDPDRIDLERLLVAHLTEVKERLSS